MLQDRHLEPTGTVTTPAAFNLGLCRLRGKLSPPASAKVILQAGHSSLPLRRWAAGGPFFFAATKIRIGRGRSLPLRNQQAKPFSPASIPKSGPEIKNRCTHEDVNGEKLTSIRKFGLEIKNRCTKEGVNGEKLTSIRKSGLEIKNRCTQQATFGTRL